MLYMYITIGRVHADECAKGCGVRAWLRRQIASHRRRSGYSPLPAQLVQGRQPPPYLEQHGDTEAFTNMFEGQSRRCIEQDSVIG